MSTAAGLYPATPADVPVSVTQPSAAFKKEVTLVMLSIVLFFLVYIVLIVLAAALVAACVAGGVMLIIALPKGFIILLGIGLMGLGVMVFFFLIKFIFTVSKVDRSGSIQVTEAEQPQLFAFIRQVTKDTQTPFPKKIFISPEVNASVSYNSSFWSMLFPVRKNLTIGLGLVNILNLSEFKAVMAHEFGHFSQRSMKLGSFVYNVNRVIYNMLYDNAGYEKFINRWANASGFFALFATLTVKIVQGIQWVLRNMYSFINKNYMGLSRQMEFHADAVAASVSGSQNCINALRRIELADTCYHTVVNKYNELYKQNIVCNNLYPSQHLIMQRVVKENKLQLDGHQLPVIDEDFFKTSNYARVNFKDQWASHPARTEREAHLRGLNVKGETREESAWSIFRQQEQLQEKLTAKLYESVEIGENMVRFDPQQFEERYKQDVSTYAYPQEYNGFYNNRELTEIDVQGLAASAASQPFSPSDFNLLFTPENGSIETKIEFLEGDMQTLQHIIRKEIDAKTFDFDGEKYDRAEAPAVLASLEKEKEQLQKQQRELDEKAFVFFYHCAARHNRQEELKNDYEAIAALTKETHDFYRACNALLHLLNPLFAGQQLTEVYVSDMVRQLKEIDEPKFKKMLREFSGKGVFDSDAEFKAKVEKFVGADYVYFSNNHVFDNEFLELHALIMEGSSLAGLNRYMKMKGLAEKQLAMYKSQGQ